MEREDYQIFSFGQGDSGQLGINVDYEGLKVNIPTPISLLEGKKFSQICSGSKHNLFLESNILKKHFFVFMIRD
jgi:alpha-tubulin suppressor-like RCC1 family protein